MFDILHPLNSHFQNQSEIVKKRGRSQVPTTQPLSKCTAEPQISAASPKASSEVQPASVKIKSPGTGKMKARPTRSNSVEITFLEGLQRKILCFFKLFLAFLQS